MAAFRTVISIAIVCLAILPACCRGDGLDRAGIMARCPTLTSVSDRGELDQVSTPVFTERASARSFAADCGKIASELSRFGSLPVDLAQLRLQAAMSAEFLKGDTVDLSASTVPSVVKLREWAGIAPPRGLVYVRKYSAGEAMPRRVAEAFTSLNNREDRARVQGVTIDGRVIALLRSDYHDELADNLGHELVHAYITLVSPRDLPKWFQEGAAVYFSTGQDTKLYGRTGDPMMKQVSIPEDYKTRLYSFQYIEKRIGRKKLLDFVKRAVDTGKPDPRAALGMSGPPEPFKPPVAKIAGLIAGVTALFGGAWFISHRRERID